MRWCLITVFAFCTQAIIYCHAEQCNRDQLERCESAIISILDNNHGSHQDIESYCRNIYRRLHCLITQTSMCLSPSERQRKSPLIHKTWRFLASICDGFAAWWRFDCFQQDGIKHCESRFTDNRNVNYASCRNYRQFRECATMVVKSRCLAQEEALLGIYLLDKGRERTWLCSADDPTEEDNQVSSAPLASESDYHNDEDCRLISQSEAKKCNKHAEERTRYLERNSEPNLEEKCCSMKKYEECASDIIKRYCGGNDWIFLDSLKLEEFGNEMKCPDTPKCSNAANKIIGTFVLSLTVLITLSNILFD